MRYLVLFGVFFIYTCIYAQQSPVHFPDNSEKYYCLYTNAYLMRSPYAKVRDTLEKLQKAAFESGDRELEGSLKLFAYVKMNQEQLVGADTTVYRLLSLATYANTQKLRRLEANALQSLGTIYNRSQLQSAAAEQFVAAYSIYSKFNFIEFPQKQDYVYEIGLMYYKYQDYENAIRYLKEALYLKQSNSSQFSPISNAIGLCYRNMKQYDSAIYYFINIYDTALRRNDKVWIGLSQGNIGITYFYQNKYKEAEPLLQKNIKSSVANSSIKDAVTSMTILAAIYEQWGKYDDAEQILLNALAFAHEKSFWSDYVLAEKIYEQLHKVYRSKKLYTFASLYADSALMAKDSVASRNNAIVISKALEKQNFISKKFADEKRQNQEILNKVENDKRQMEQQQLLYKFVIGFLIVVFMLAIVVNRNRNNLLKISTNKKDAPEIVVQKMSIVIISIATCAAALVWTSLYYYYYGICVVTILPFTYFLLVGPSLLIYFFIKKTQLLVNVQLFCIFFITLMIEFYSGGFKGGVVINWAFLAPVGALMYKGIRHAAFWMILFIVSIICLAVFYEHFLPFYHPISEVAQYMFNCMNIIGPAIVIYFSMQFFVKSVIRDGRLLQENNLLLSNTLGELKLEKQKSDDLLLNILPEEVADELKLKGTTKATYFDNVTVLFTDFVNFTSAGAFMDPQSLVDELHTCFKKFDEITSKYGIEKIKTVGDAYLAVSGLPVANTQHAENTVSAATEISAFMRERLSMQENNTFAIRIGIHSGSVVAGVVGVKKFAYDIWGDTVNTAARMEQNSTSGHINISQTTYNLVKDKFKCTYRGEIEAKGKGMLKMYYVE